MLESCKNNGISARTLSSVCDKTSLKTNVMINVALIGHCVHLYLHLTAVSGVGSSPTLATCETTQVLLAGVPAGFSRGSPVFTYLLIGPSHMS